MLNRQLHLHCWLQVWILMGHTTPPEMAVDHLLLNLTIQMYYFLYNHILPLLSSWPELTGDFLDGQCPWTTGNF